MNQLDSWLEERKGQERVEVVDENTGEPTGPIIPKKLSHQSKTGIAHPVVVVVIYQLKNDVIQVLLQQRGGDVGLLPLRRDFGVTGHIKAGESVEVAGLREGAEEINLTGVEEADFRHLRGTLLTFEKGEYIIKHYAQYLFLQLRPGIEFKPSKEVESLKWRTEPEIFETLEIDSEALVPFEEIVPGHRTRIFSIIRKELDRKIDQKPTNRKSIIIVA